MRIGFLLNHQAVHQVPHSAPYAFELSRRHPEFEVIIAASTQAEFDLAGTIGNLYPGHRCEMLRLNPEWWYSLVDPVLSKITFKHKKRVLENNLEFFRGLDTLVAPERKCRYLRTRYGLDDLKLIHVRHGAGDRECRPTATCRCSISAILPGQKYVDRLTTLGCLRPGQYAVAGWPKFEVVRGLNRDGGGCSTTIIRWLSTIRILTRRLRPGKGWAGQSSTSSSPIRSTTSFWLLM